MRIRSIKPEFWRSQDIADLAWDFRLVYIGLWSYVDDNGVGRDDWRIITAELFALDDPLTEPSLRVQEALDVLYERGMIARYTVNGKAYIEVLAWDRHQVINRPSKPRFPRSDADSAEPHVPLTEPSLNPQWGLSAGTGEQGNRGTGDFYSPSKSQSSSNRARVSTDAIEISPMTKRLAAQKGITSLRVVVDAIGRHTSARVTADQAFQLCTHLLDKAKTFPDAPQRYVVACIEQSPAEVEKHLYEQIGVAS